VEKQINPEDFCTRFGPFQANGSMIDDFFGRTLCMVASENDYVSSAELAEIVVSSLNNRAIKSNLNFPPGTRGQ
jgi:hypothetical protein